MVKDYGLHAKAGFIGLSRGGSYLAKAKIPLLLVYGDRDSVVPHAMNSSQVSLSGGAGNRSANPLPLTQAYNDTSIRKTPDVS